MNRIGLHYVGLTRIELDWSDRFGLDWNDIGLCWIYLYCKSLESDRIELELNWIDSA